MKTLSWSIFIILALGIGVYPFAYFLFDMRYGLLATKSSSVLDNVVWQFTFRQHIVFGAIAMLSGWSQFSKRFRSTYLTWHQWLGRIYVVSVLLSGSAGLYIAFFATGGLVASAGFTGLALAWMITTTQAFLTIRMKQIDSHQHWMIRSYALCFAAVTLRIWLPLFQFAFGVDFLLAYRAVAWICWVPNLMVAEVIIRSLRSRMHVQHR